MKKSLLLVLLLSLLSGCNSSRYASHGEYIYMQSHNGVPLVVPPPLTTAYISHFYDLPPQPDNPRVSIQPPGLSTTG